MSQNQKYQSEPGGSHHKGTTAREALPVVLSALIILLTLGFMFAESPRDQSLKIGYVDSSTILGLLPDAQAAQAKLDTLVQDWSDTLKQMSTEYQTDVNDYTRQAAMLTERAKQEQQEQINNLLQKMQAYRQKTIGQGGILDQTRERMMKPIRQRVYKAIAVVARREGMQLVLDKNEQIPVVLYADPFYDITYKVLDVLSRQQVN